MNSVTEALLYFLDHQKELEKHHPPLDDDKTVDTILHEAENYHKNRKHDILSYPVGTDFSCFFKHCVTFLCKQITV